MQQPAGPAGQGPPLDMEVKMLRRRLVRYPINNKKVTADTIVHCRGKGFKAVGLLGSWSSRLSKEVLYKRADILRS